MSEYTFLFWLIEEPLIQILCTFQYLDQLLQTKDQVHFFLTHACVKNWNKIRLQLLCPERVACIHVVRSKGMNFAAILFIAKYLVQTCQTKPRQRFQLTNNLPAVFKHKCLSLCLARGERYYAKWLRTFNAQKNAYSVCGQPIRIYWYKTVTNRWVQSTLKLYNQNKIY